MELKRPQCGNSPYDTEKEWGGKVTAERRSEENLKQVIDGCQLYLQTAREEGDREAEGLACKNLGLTYAVLKDFKRAIEYHGLHLKISREMGNRIQEGVASGNLAMAYSNIGDYKTAAIFYEIQLEIARKLGQVEVEMKSCAMLGLMFYKMTDFKKVSEYHDVHNLNNAEEVDRFTVGMAHENHGTHDGESLKNFHKAVNYYKLSLDISKKVGAKLKEFNANYDLGNIFYRIGDINSAVAYRERSLEIAQAAEDVAMEGKTRFCLGNDYYCLGKFKKAITHFERHLRISKDTEDRHKEARAILILGNACYNIGDFRKAIAYHERCLNISKEVGERAEEGLAYGSLGNDYNRIGDLKKAIQCHEHCLRIHTEIGNRAGECMAYCGLGNAYGGLGNYQKAVEYFERCLKIATEIGDNLGEASGYGGLGNTYLDIGNLRKAVECHQRELKLAIQLGDQLKEGQAHSNLGKAYFCLRDFKKAIRDQERHLQIAKHVGNISEEGIAYSNLGNSYHELGDFKKSIDYHKRSLEIAMEQEDRATIGNAYGNLGRAYLCLGDPKRAKDYQEHSLEIAQEVGDRVAQAKILFGLGRSLELLGYLYNSLDCYQSSVELLNNIRTAPQFKDEWKINLRHTYRNVYTKSWLLLLKQGRTRDALFAAERGRAQALNDLMEFNYGLNTTSSCEFQTMEEFSGYSLVSVQSIFTAVRGDEVYFWVLQKGRTVCLRRKKVSDDGSLNGAARYIQNVIESVRETIGVRSEVICEDRSLEMLEETNMENATCDVIPSDSLDYQENPLKTLYNIAVRPIGDLIDGDKLIIVPDGPLWLAPYAAFVDSNSKYLSESFRIRVIPSLTTLKLIVNCPVEYHQTRGALLVGDPWVQQIVTTKGSKLYQLPCAREEVNMIGKLVNTAPLIGTEATKEEVLKRLPSVALVHIAAHGRMESGEIALTPNPSSSSKPPKFHS